TLKDGGKGLNVSMFTQRHDPLSCLNKAMAFVSTVAASRQGQSYASTGYKGGATSFGGNNAGGQARVVKCYNCQDSSIPDGQASQKTISNNVAFQTGDLDAYDSDCDDVFTTQAILMASLSNYGSDVISEKAQRIKPTLYDGSVICSQHVVIPVIDDEETLILEKVESSKTLDSNTPVLPSTGLKSSTNASRSQPTGNKKNDGILQTPSSNMKK
nr:hypothetical protein [Tanacetum cinerariifolium]